MLCTDNWWEDRIQRCKKDQFETRLDDRIVRPYESDCDAVVGFNTVQGQYPFGKTPRLQRHKKPATTRTIPQDFLEGDPMHSRHYSTTKLEADSHLHEVQLPVRKPSMLTTKSLSKTIHANRTTKRQHPLEGFGQTLPRHKKDEFGAHFDTTNGDMYIIAPKLAKESNPLMYPPVDRSRFMQGSLRRDLLDHQRTGREIPRGKCGTRGELVRHPEESGNVYGNSTWVDEFALWGTSRKGRQADNPCLTLRRTI
ncbi:hypothetical protein BSKO_08638 [Bryopsis sp. KO-2023]|nr:hypothetical protein BSKO_08638 [Bryopsis sp. KO-2023]